MAVVKKAVKTTTAKKTTTAAKPAAKKATTAKAKPAAKAVKPKAVAKPKVAAKAKPVVITKPKSSGDISLNGNKMIKTIQSEFNKKFPYMRICIFPESEKIKQAKGETIYQYADDKRLADIRRKGTVGDITITGNKLVRTLEKEFENVYGLFAQVCYTNKEGNRYYTSGSTDEMTLTALNKHGEDIGWKKGIKR
jgi:hypothetical protein